MMNAKNDADKKAMYAIRAKLYAVNSYFAYQDFKRENPEGRKYSKKGAPLPYKPYSLSPLTQEAREMYKASQGVIWADTREEKIKGYLMRLRLSGDLDKILDWEMNTGNYFKTNPWRSVLLDQEVSVNGQDGDLVR